MNRRTILAGAAFTAIAAPATGAVPPAVLHFDHVSLNVRDFEAALAWYQGRLGFRVEVAWRVAALGGKRLAYLRLNDTVLELVEADAGGASLPEAMTFPEHFARTGYGHLCFRVDSVDAVLAALADGGVPTFVRAETYDLDGTPWRRRVGFVKDMEGNVLEFGEPLIRA
jgi:catechol 2,3-dioxygenase-like lactoylglutathione lyase family enzyme